MLAMGLVDVAADAWFASAISPRAPRAPSPSAVLLVTVLQYYYYWELHFPIQRVSETKPW